MRCLEKMICQRRQKNFRSRELEAGRDLRLLLLAARTYFLVENSSHSKEFSMASYESIKPPKLLAQNDNNTECLYR